MLLQGPRQTQQAQERVRRSSSGSEVTNLSRLAERALKVAAQSDVSIVTVPKRRLFLTNPEPA